MTPWKIAMEKAAREAGVTWLTCPHSEIADAAALAALSEWTADILRALPEPPEFRAARDADVEMMREAVENIKALLSLHIAHHNNPAHAAARILLSRLEGCQI